MRYKNLIIIGTSHISPESVRSVEYTIIKSKPEIVCLELDRKRLASLLEKRKRGVSVADIKRVGLKGFLFALIGAWAEKRLGEKTGIMPGAEMLKAYKTAIAQGARIALIDQDIEVTLKKLSKSISWKEKWHFLVDIIQAAIFRKGARFDLRKVPSQSAINKLVAEVKKRYPNLYMVLVTERNDIMAKNIFKLMSFSPNKDIVAVVGAGHEKEIIDMLKGKRWE